MADIRGPTNEATYMRAYRSHVPAIPSRVSDVRTVVSTAAYKGAATRKVAPASRETGAAETAWMTGEATGATGKSAGVATKATRATPGKCATPTECATHVAATTAESATHAAAATTKCATHVAASTATAVEATATTGVPTAAAATTPAMSAAAAVLGEGWRADRKKRGQGDCPQRGLVP